MIIDKERSLSPLTGERWDYEDHNSQSLTFNSHSKLITSFPVLEKVIEDLALDQIDKKKRWKVNPFKDLMFPLKKKVRYLFKELLSKLRKTVKSLIGHKDKEKASTSIPKNQEKLFRLIEKLQAKIHIQKGLNTRLLRVSVEDHDPIMARDISNSLAKIYIQYNIANQLKHPRNNMNWMTGKLYEVKKKYDDADEEFLDYKQREKLFSIKEKQDIITRRIEEFNYKYLEDRNRRIELDAKLAKIRQSSLSKEDILYVRFLTGNPLIDRLYNTLLNAKIELNRLSKIYRSKHSKVIQIRTKIETTKKKINDEIKREVENLKARRSVLLVKEKALQKTLTEFENDALEINRRELKYTLLQRNVETNQKFYDTLLSKIKEYNIMNNFDGYNIRIVEEAVIPLTPLRPKKLVNIIMSVILSLMIGIGFALCWEYMDQSLQTEEDIQRYLGLQVLSVIPKADNTKSIKQNT